MSSLLRFALFQSNLSMATKFFCFVFKVIQTDSLEYYMLLQSCRKQLQATNHLKVSALVGGSNYIRLSQIMEWCQHVRVLRTLLDCSLSFTVEIQDDLSFVIFICGDVVSVVLLQANIREIRMLFFFFFLFLSFLCQHKQAGCFTETLNTSVARSCQVNPPK